MAIPTADQFEGLEFIDSRGSSIAKNPPQLRISSGSNTPKEKRRQPVSKGGMMSNFASLTPVELEDDKEPWERQSAERINHYRWFETYRNLDTSKFERSLNAAYRAANISAGERISTKLFRHVAKVWRWQYRAECWDEWVFRQERASYLRSIEAMAARQARRGVLTANIGVTILRALMKRFQASHNELSFGELRRMMKPALDALEMGQREERQARGFQRAITVEPEQEENLFEKLLNQSMDIEESPELEEAFQELEQVLVQTTTTTTVQRKRKGRPLGSGKKQPALNDDELIDSYVTKR